MASDTDDEITLSSSALDALQAFYAERDEHARRFAELQTAAAAAAGLPVDDDDGGGGGGGAAAASTSAAPASAPATDKATPLSMALFAEDWNESQFWYTDDTARVLARQLLDGTDASSLVAVVSGPSVYVALRNMVADRPATARPRLVLLEYDRRFAVLGDDFVFYDFRAPTRLPAALRGAADRVFCDPPFLSEDCQTKAALTARWLGRAASPPAGGSGGSGGSSGSSGNSGPRIIVCTGERMGTLLTTKLYRAQGVRVTTFEPQHARGLSNEFCCYANFECDAWRWRGDEDGRQ